MSNKQYLAAALIIVIVHLLAVLLLQLERDPSLYWHCVWRKKIE
jgi:hypothetical protein